MGIRDLSRVVLRRRSLIFGCILLAALAGLTAYLLTKHLYSSTATLELLKESNGSFLVGQGDNAPTDALDFNLTLQTQVNLLKSDVLAMQVIDELHLLGDDTTFEKILTKSDTRDKSALPPVESLAPHQQAAALAIFAKHLKVEPVSGTRLIRVSFTDQSPQTAAAVANRLVQDYLGFNGSIHNAGSAQASSAMEKPLQKLKEDVQQSLGKVAVLQRNMGIYGPDEMHNVITARMEQLSTELVSADDVLANKQAIAKAADSGNPDLIAGLVNTGNSSNGASPTLVLFQNLRDRQSEASANLASLKAKFGPNYPKVIEARKRLEDIDAAIASETAKLRTRAVAEYQVAKNVRDINQRELDEQTKAAAALNDRAAEYSLAKREAEAKDTLYQQLLGRITEAQALAGFRSTEVAIIDSGKVADRSSSPSGLIDLVALPLAGLILGMALAFLLDLLDGTVRDPDQVERTTGMALMTILPRIGGDRNGRALSSPSLYLTSLREPGSRVAEGFHRLRAEITARDSRAKIVLVSSPVGGEGRVFTTLNLAVDLAHSGLKVLVVDADLRRGELSRLMGLSSSSTGLTTMLKGPVGMDAVAHPLPELPNLTVLPRGPNASECSLARDLGKFAGSMQSAQSYFDVIVICGPPLVSTHDALEIARLSDFTLVVLRFGRTTKVALQQSVRLLGSLPSSKVGYVLNGMDPKGPDFTDRVGAKEYSYVAS